MVRPSRHGLGRVWRWLYRDRETLHLIGEADARGRATLPVAPSEGDTVTLSYSMPQGAVGARFYAVGHVRERARLRRYAPSGVAIAEREAVPVALAATTMYARATALAQKEGEA